MGVGGSLLGASSVERHTVGIDLNIKYIETYKEASIYLNLKQQQTYCGDALFTR